MIYIQDYLKNEDNLIMSDDLKLSDLNCNNRDDLISFPSEPQDEISKEEIGKWVDQLMEMPDAPCSHPEILEELSDSFEDPFTSVAERILSEERF